MGVEMASEQESVALICHESQMLRLRVAELEGRAMTMSQELRESLERHRVLMKRLRESHASLRRILDETSYQTLEPAETTQRNQRGSAR
jgi:hypothetical protein